MECKSTSFHKAEDWAEDGIPIYYEFQLRFYLAVADCEFGDFSCIWGTNPNTDMAMPSLTRDKVKEEMIFERLDQWIWSLKHDKPPTMDDVKPSLALEALACIYGASKQGQPTIEFPKKYEKALRGIASLQQENAAMNRKIKENEGKIEAHSVRIAEVMKEHEHGILETTSDKLLVDFVTRTTKRVNSKLLQQTHPDIYTDCLNVSESRKVKVSIAPI